MLSYEELEDLMEKIYETVTLANRCGELNTLLLKWGLQEFAAKSSAYDTEKNGKIVVIGASEVKENVLIGIIKELGLNKDRFEFCLDYKDAKTYPYKKLQYDTNYRAVLFGPVPHSSTGKKDSSSVIAEMREKEGYPRVEILNGNNAIKITKSNFKRTLSRLIQDNYI